MDEEAGGAIVNIDLSKVELNLNQIVKSLAPDSKKIVRDCAITLYTNTNFEMNEKSPIQIAHECVNRAIIMGRELKLQGLIDDLEVSNVIESPEQE